MEAVSGDIAAQPRQYQAFQRKLGSYLKSSNVVLNSELWEVCCHTPADDDFLGSVSILQLLLSFAGC